MAQNLRVHSEKKVGKPCTSGSAVVTIARHVTLKSLSGKL